jgi:hypothetical protein
MCCTDCQCPWLCAIQEKRSRNVVTVFEMLQCKHGELDSWLVKGLSNACPHLHVAHVEDSQFLEAAHQRRWGESYVAVFQIKATSIKTELATYFHISAATECACDVHEPWRIVLWLFKSIREGLCCNDIAVMSRIRAVFTSWKV